MQTYLHRRKDERQQVVRATILKHYRSLSYKELAFHLDDSVSFRAFARWSRGQHTSTSTLQDNIKKESECQKCYRDLLQIAAQVKGYAVRVIARLWVYSSPDAEQVVCARMLADELERLMGFLERVADQARRRVIEGEKVAAGERVASV
jgi:hypothetical protein